MDSNQIKNTVRENGPTGEPTPIVHHLGRIFIFGVLTLILIGAGMFLWTKSNSATSGPTGTNSSNANAVQPPS